MGTYLAKARHGKIRWRVLDADGLILGKLAVGAARLLTGKDSPDYTPHVDHRDGVIVVNAGKVRLTGRKLEQKIYRHHTGYPGGLKAIAARDFLATKPEKLVREAIVGMLPKTRLGDRIATRLKVYAGPTHPHTGQRPEVLSL